MFSLSLSLSRSKKEACLRQHYEDSFSMFFLWLHKNTDKPRLVTFKGARSMPATMQ